MSRGFFAMDAPVRRDWLVSGRMRVWTSHLIRMVGTVGQKKSKPHMPSDVTAVVGFFDRFASETSRFFSKPWFFAFCVLTVLVWAPSILVIRTVDTWQLVINTVTTIVTFLMVALLQNTQTRQDKATQDKLNAIAKTLGELAKKVNGDSEAPKEAKAAVGVEKKESA